MLSKTRAVFVCLLVALSASCASSTPEQLPVSTPASTPQLPTPTATSAAQPTATFTPPPTRVPSDVIRADNLTQVQMLHEYWTTIATAAGVDPYEMGLSAVAASPDGRSIAVGGCSQPLEADLRSGNIYCNSQNPEGPNGVPFLLILDANAARVTAVIPENEPNTTIADLAFTPDGKKLVYAVQPGRFILWDLASGRIESTLWQGETSAPRIAISPDGKWLALKTATQAEIWDASVKEFVTKIPAYLRPQFSADGKRIVVSQDRQFVIYETGTWTEALRLGMPCDCVYAFSPDLTWLATADSGSAENTPVLLWDVATGQQLQSLPADNGFTKILAFTPDGKMLWRASDRGDVTAWSTGDWQLLARHIGGVVPIMNLQGLQFTADGRNYLLFSDLHLGLYGLP